ncbi:hypothetical protein U728_1049 [Clostridium botulinum 202F]|nr:hypothetical protein U728_1049 [Clostridium botulinum 202F]KAI3345968.1 hypothetical protein CIT17_10310 [Clostridium botulinum]KON13464.1 hypothetical protein ACP50_05170 [Clostridium botulinum]MBY6987831.1 hypothetical protein [Clostridium botulinum]NFH02203.1 hypothetical protein [Clostridium botulinum]
MIKNYVEKDDIFEAIQWDGNNLQEILDFCNIASSSEDRSTLYFKTNYFDESKKQIIKGNVKVEIGEYIYKYAPSGMKKMCFKMSKEEFEKDNIIVKPIY